MAFMCDALPDKLSDTGRGSLRIVSDKLSETVVHLSLTFGGPSLSSF